MPLCADPAPLYGEADAAAPGYVVVFRDGVEPLAATDRLAREHGFVPSHVYQSALSGFSAVLTPAALAAIRCHPAVKYVEHDASARLF